jgi:hypothetical protein
VGGHDVFRWITPAQLLSNGALVRRVAKREEQTHCYRVAFDLGQRFEVEWHSYPLGADSFDNAEAAMERYKRLRMICGQVVEAGAILPA